MVADVFAAASDSVKVRVTRFLFNYKRVTRILTLKSRDLRPESHVILIEIKKEQPKTTGKKKINK